MPFIAGLAKLMGISPLRVVLWLAAVALVVAAYLVLRSHYINIGEERQAAAFAAQDAKALKNVQAAKQKVDACYRRGGHWSAALGVCE